MAAKQLSEVVKGVIDGEDSDTAYARLYADQVKPCDFRRWFAQVLLTGLCVEVDDKMLGDLKGYVAEKMTVEEAFATHVPGFVGPGEFLTAYSREIKARKAQPEKASPQVVKHPKKKPEIVEDTVVPEGATLI
jgi:hypothetical protein